VTYRVAAWSTGNVGRNAIAGIDARPDLELAGVWTSTAAKAGKDAGELAGLGRDLGVTATTDAGALLALRPDCVVYTSVADVRPAEAVGDLCRILRAGVNVVSSSAMFLQFPDGGGVPSELVDPVREAAAAGGASIFVNGIDPGFANDLLPLAVTGISERIDRLRCMEIINLATYDQGEVLFDFMGFGRPPTGRNPPAAAATASRSAASRTAPSTCGSSARTATSTPPG
jgi:4-hydroxy-tetrahydrodipicolinate reductase